MDVGTCAECICGVESNEELRGCGTEHNSADPACPKGCSRKTGNMVKGAPCYCGAFQITDDYYNECKTGTMHQIKKSFLKCTLDNGCAKKCVENYLDKFQAKCGATTCAKLMVLHRNGPAKCKTAKLTRKERRMVQGCCDTPGERFRAAVTRQVSGLGLL